MWGTLCGTQRVTRHADGRRLEPHTNSKPAPDVTCVPHMSHAPHIPHVTCRMHATHVACASHNDANHKHKQAELTSWCQARTHTSRAHIATPSMTADKNSSHHDANHNRWHGRADEWEHADGPDVLEEPAHECTWDVTCDMLMFLSNVFMHACEYVTCDMRHVTCICSSGTCTFTHASALFRDGNMSACTWVLTLVSNIATGVHASGCI